MFHESAYVLKDHQKLPQFCKDLAQKASDVHDEGNIDLFRRQMLVHVHEKKYVAIKKSFVEMIFTFFSIMKIYPLVFFCILFQFFAHTPSSFAEQGNIILPSDEEVSFTDRFILSELKEIRMDQEQIKREVIIQIHEKQLESIDKALNYSANTLNYFFIFFTIIFMIIGLIGWKTIRDLKTSAKEVVEKEIKKIIEEFQEKISDLERRQRINILWRNFNSSDNPSEKLDILEKIESIARTSKEVLIEKSSLYLSMGIFHQVIEICDQILSEHSSDETHALFNRASAYAALEDLENAEKDILHLLNVAPQYETQIEESEYLEKILKSIDR